MKKLHENISTIQEDTLINATRLIEKSERLIFIGYAASDAVVSV